MKLSLAAVILSQSLPVLSRQFSHSGHWTTSDLKKVIDHSSQVTPKSKLKHDRTLESFHTQRRLGLLSGGLPLKNTPHVATHHVPCDPVSMEADTGILSCGNGNFCKPFPASELGGICAPMVQTNERSDAELSSPSQGPHSKNYQTAKQEDVLVQCNSELIDLGILTCGDDEFCETNESSGLGGYCVGKSLVPRKLLLLDDYLNRCDPSPDYPQLSCDCSDLKNGTGTMYCFYKNTSFVNGCDDILMDDAYWMTFQDSISTKLEDCYTVIVPYYQKACFVTYGQYLNDSCSITLNNETCNSCIWTTDFYDFDCSNVPGGTTGSSLAEFSPMFSECYAVTTFTCTSLCSDGFYIPDSNYDVNVTVGEYGDYSCGYLAYVAPLAYIPDYACSAFMEAAQIGCCTPLGSIKPEPETSSPTPSPSRPSPGPEDTEDSTAQYVFTKRIALMIILATTSLLHISSG